jgi:hypothetical protein
LQRAGEFNIRLDDVSITHLTFGKVVMIPGFLWWMLMEFVTGVHTGILYSPRDFTLNYKCFTRLLKQSKLLSRMLRELNSLLKRCLILYDSVSELTSLRLSKNGKRLSLGQRERPRQLRRFLEP